MNANQPNAAMKTFKAPHRSLTAISSAAPRRRARGPGNKTPPATSSFPISSRRKARVVRRRVPRPLTLTLGPSRHLSLAKIQNASSRAPRDLDPAKRWLAFLRKPSGSDCGDGLLHRANDYVRCALLLLRHQPRSSAHPAFQCHKPPYEPVDRSTATGRRFRSSQRPGF
jgi:hypothetical protein